MINLVDLAGSERVSKSYAQGKTLEEAKKINSSLSTLGMVISSIAKNSAHIPYRDSKLTRLLKESLGGNNKTTLVVACSMHYSQTEETLSTMRFAQSAKLIQNRVRMNFKNASLNQSQLSEQNLALTNMVSNLKQELETTKSELNNLTSKFKTSIVDPVKRVNQSCGNFEINDIKDKEIKALKKQVEQYSTKNNILKKQNSELKELISVRDQQISMLQSKDDYETLQLQLEESLKKIEK